jgi:pimeloyl-ACP methyl ester carboxylesterase
VINPQDYLLMITYALYNKVSIASLPELINSINENNHLRLRQAVNVIRNTLNTINGAMYMSVAAFEELPFSGNDEIQKELRMFPNLSPGPAFYISDPFVLESWHNARASENEDSPVTSEKPILLVSGRFDPVTPPSNAGKMLPYLTNAQHIVFESESHAIFSQCYYHILSRFFNEPDGEYMSDCYQFDNSLTIN